jgi:hypothetical protein
MVAIGAATGLVVPVIMGSPFGLPASTFLLRRRLDVSFEGEERLSPEALEVRSQRGERLRIDCIDAARPVGAVCNQVGTLENPQMLRNGRAAHRELTGEFADGQRAVLYQARENGPASAIAECVKLWRMVSIHLR